MTDPIHHPPHYAFSSIEVIDAIEAWELSFHLGNVVKYVARASRKGRTLEDLQKARWYLARAMMNLDQDIARIEAGTEAEGTMPEDKPLRVKRKKKR